MLRKLKRLIYELAPIGDDVSGTFGHIEASDYRALSQYPNIQRMKIVSSLRIPLWAGSTAIISIDPTAEML